MTIAAPRTGSALPRLGMSWVTFRQHRAALIGVFLLLGALAIGMVITGLHLHATYRHLGLNRCSSFTTGQCAQLSQIFLSENTTYGDIQNFLPLLPGIIGVFTGAPLVAREFEGATFRFAWTQGVGRTRWIVVQLLLIAGVLTAMALAFSLLYSWWEAPLEGPAGLAFGKLISFVFGGIDFAAFTVFTFALGAFVGVVIRRTVAAMAVTFAVWFVLFVWVAQALRAHYLPALTTTLAPPARAWVLKEQSVDPSGHVLSRSQDVALYTAVQAAKPTSTGGRPDKRQAHQTYRNWLLSHHYGTVTTYQPAGRFWTFQIIEASWLCLLAILLGAGVLWWVRHRAT